MSTETSGSDRVARGRPSLIRAIVLKLVWEAVVLGALALLLRGLVAGVYFEPTGEAIAEAQRGKVLVGVACCLLIAAAGYALLVAPWPSWVGAGLLAPVLLCGGLTWLASETLFPQLAMLVAYPAALAGAAGGLVARSGSATAGERHTVSDR
jgi:hypothetical protein